MSHLTPTVHEVCQPAMTQYHGIVFQIASTHNEYGNYAN